MRQNIRNIIEKLSQFHNVSDNELLTLLTSEFSDDENKLLRQRADECRKKNYGTDVYIRGLIEFSNICKNTCKYCGLNCFNKKPEIALADSRLKLCVFFFHTDFV